MNEILWAVTVTSNEIPVVVSLIRHLKFHDGFELFPYLNDEKEHVLGCGLIDTWPEVIVQESERIVVSAAGFMNRSQTWASQRGEEELGSPGF